MNAVASLEMEKAIRVFESIDFEKIIDHPNILIAANFWDDERYKAAKSCYKFMRYIDDFVDNYKSEHKTVPAEKQEIFETHVNNWIQSVVQPENGEVLFPEITDTIRKFHIPMWSMEDFATAMIYDIYNDGFDSLDAFINYAGGASVAPASVFVHLCGLTQKNGQYLSPEFDVKAAATPCAIFSYLVHIIRDFVKDHTRNLNYFPLDLMRKYDLNRENLLTMANGGELSPGFRAMIRELYDKAEEYRLETIKKMAEIKPGLDYNSQLSLEIIFSLYTMVYERIDLENGQFTTEELNPTSEEIKSKVFEIIKTFDYDNAQ